MAPIQGKDVLAGSLVLLGQRVATTPLTQFTGHATGPGRPNRNIGYADLILTDRVEVRAYQDDSGQLVATRVERTEPATRC